MQDDCILWPGPYHDTGYGKEYEFGSKERYAHRWAYKRAFGSIPKGMDVCHKCDVKICVNPNHLELGPRSKNTKDMWARGLASRTHGATLNELEVLEIRQRHAEGELQKDLAKEFGVSGSQISRIVLRKEWRHI